MGSPARGFLTWCLFVAPMLGVLNALSLADYQAIGGFSSACTDAYKTPFSACTTADFAHGEPCSKECIKNLDDLTLVIIAACEGTPTFQDTLIGAFFVGQGTKSMCPNAPDSISTAAEQPAGTSAASAKPSHSTTTISPTKSSSRPSSPTLTTSSSISTATTSTPESTDNSSITSTTIDSTTQPTSTTIDSMTQPTSTTRSTIPLSLLTAASSTVASAAEATTSSSDVKATHGGRDGGGGTPFDITSSSSRNAQVLWMPLVSTCIVILRWLV